MLKVYEVHRPIAIKNIDETKCYFAAAKLWWERDLSYLRLREIREESKCTPSIPMIKASIPVIITSVFDVELSKTC